MRYKATEVAGTGGFMTEKELEKYNKGLEPEPEDKDQPSPNMIMSMNFRRPIDMRAMIGNNNVLVVVDPELVNPASSSNPTCCR